MVGFGFLALLGYSAMLSVRDFTVRQDFLRRLETVIMKLTEQEFVELESGMLGWRNDLGPLLEGEDYALSQKVTAVHDRIDGRDTAVVDDMLRLAEFLIEKGREVKEMAERLGC